MLSERDPAEDVGGQPLLSLVLLERLLPVREGEGEDAGFGPRRQQAQEVPDVRQFTSRSTSSLPQRRASRGADTRGINVLSAVSGPHLGVVLYPNTEWKMPGIHERRPHHGDPLVTQAQES